MHIEILDFSPSGESGKRPMVAFSSACGLAWAQWCGSEMPRVGMPVNAEIEIPDEIDQWAIVDGPDVVASDAPGSPVRIRGAVAAVDEDSVTAIRVGADIVLVEFTDPLNSTQPDQALRPGVGDFIEFTTPRIEVYPYSV
ncbi:hypothetical protein ACIBJF_36200 [Streptomyces sp. NPDC050743]|uniref:hypothetical protein n=1 Tax=Streptomyces sp. NPDC050743 TaxID=3365634 RepID=UPI0037ABF515